MTITEFLLARIAEDEAAASQRYLAVPPWGHPIDTMSDCDCGDHVADTYLIIDPARVLAECEAKRRIVGLHALEDSIRRPDTDMKVYVCKTCDADDLRWTLPSDVDAWPCDTIRALASVYADHPDYREEWRA